MTFSHFVVVVSVIPRTRTPRVVRFWPLHRAPRIAASHLFFDAFEPAQTQRTLGEVRSWSAAPILAKSPFKSWRCASSKVPVHEPKVSTSFIDGELVRERTENLGLWIEVQILETKRRADRDGKRTMMLCEYI